MAAETQYTANTGMVKIATANANLDGTGTLGTVITGAANGTLIKNVIIKATDTGATSTPDGMVRLYVGSNIIAEVKVPAMGQSTTNATFETVLPLNFKLASGAILKASTQTATGFNVIAEGLDFAVLLDLWLMGQSSAIICQNLRQKYPEIKIIVLSFLDEPELVLEMIRYGARAFISKSRPFSYVVHIIRMVMQHGYYFDQDLGDMMKIEMQKAYKKSFIDNQFRVKFNKTEMNIVTLSCAGFTIDEMAAKLRMSKRSVENYRANLLIKTDSSSF
jgi:DNA-binding NarL/FixJ family response regulator